MSAPEQARDTGGLREAAQNAIDFWDSEGEVLSLHIKALRAALSQGAAHEERGLDAPTEYAQVFTDGGGDPTLAELDGFLYAHFNARAVPAHLAVRLATPEAVPDE